VKKKSQSKNSGDRSLKSSLQDWLKAAGALVGVASAASFVVTVVYDWGFFGALGLKLSMVPTNLSDHLRSALNWMPAAIFAMGMGVLLALIWRRLVRGKSKEEVIAESKFPMIIVGVAGVGGPLVYLAFGDRFLGLLLFGAISLWLLIAFWLVPKPPLDKLNLLSVIVTLFILVPFVIWAFITGRLDGLALRNVPESTHVLIVGETKPIPVTVVRTIDKGLLVLMKGGTELRFLPWAQVVRVVDKTKPPFDGLAAKLFHGR
jgi:hypothetical protein